MAIGPADDKVHAGGCVTWVTSSDSGKGTALKAGKAEGSGSGRRGTTSPGFVLVNGDGGQGASAEGGAGKRSGKVGSGKAAEDAGTGWGKGSNGAPVLGAGSGRGLCGAAARGRPISAPPDCMAAIGARHVTGPLAALVLHV